MSVSLEITEYFSNDCNLIVYFITCFLSTVITNYKLLLKFEYKYFFLCKNAYKPSKNLNDGLLHTLFNLCKKKKVYFSFCAETCPNASVEKISEGPHLTRLI